MPKFSTPDYAPLPPYDHLKPSEIAAYLRVSCQTVYNLILDGQLKAIPLRKQGGYLVRRADFDDWYGRTFGVPIETKEPTQPNLPFLSK